MKYKTYPKMKDSGVEWIGDVPEEWELKKLKFIVEQNGGSIKPGPFGSDLTNTDFKNEGFPIYDQRYILEKNTITNFISKEKFDKMNVFQVKSGDLLITSRGTIGKSSIVSLDAQSGIIHSSIIRIRNDDSKILKNFLNSIINDTDFFRYNIKFNNNATVIDVIYGYTLKEVKLPLPPISEQKQIVKFLDSQTTKIDSEIEKNKKLVTLLQEKRQATINHAVTKGLDDSVPMKYSGIKWIGEIPEEWSIGKLKHIGSLNAGGTPSRSKKEYWDNGTIPWLSSGEVNYGIITSSHEKITELGLVESSTTKNPRGTVLLAITGEGQTRGRSALLEIEATTNQSVIGIIQNKKNMYNHFLFFYLQSQYWNLRSNSHGSVQSGLNLEIVRNYPIGIPPKYEQKQIAEFLDKQTKQYDKLISKAELQIKTLQEYRQSLISSAATGKICVTN